MTNPSEKNVLSWFQPPRRTLLLYSGLTLILTVAIGFQGIQLINRNQQLIKQQIRDKLELQLERVETELSLKFSQLADELTSISYFDSEEFAQYFSNRSSQSRLFSLIVSINEDSFLASPSGSLPYPPFIPTEVDPIEMVFFEGELLEYRDQNPVAALDFYRSKTSDPDAHIAITAYMHIGRCLKALGRIEEAEAAYSALLAYDELLVIGEPASLLGLSALCRLYAGTGQDQLFRDTLREIQQGLASRRWHIDYSTFRHYMGEVEHPDEIDNWDQISGDRAFTVMQAGDIAGGVAFSAAVDSLWRSWATQHNVGTRPQYHHEVISYFNTYILISSLSDSSRVLAILTDFDRLIAQLPELSEILSSEDLVFSMVNREGNVAFGEPSTQNPYSESISIGESPLPLTLNLARKNATETFTDVYKRIRFLAFGFSLVILTVLTAGFFLSRAVLKEINLARLQSDFVSAVSHEFRSPLTSIRQLSELIADNRVADEVQRDEYFNVISDESMRLHRLVEELLDFRRMEAGAKEFHMRPLDIKAMVHETVDLFEADVIGRRAPISREYQVHDVPVYGDREMLSRALWNLLDNAVRYSPGNPSIEVAVRRDDHHILISVTDQGLGIPIDEQKQIFNKFVRGQAAQKTIAKGSGIGLSIVKQIIDAHKGKVSVESEPGKGSTFTISLPIWKT